MARFVPKDKLSKKAQMELNRQRRITWDFSPVTKTVDSKKLYNRKRNARNRDDYGLGVSFSYQISTEPVSSPLIHQSLFWSTRTKTESAPAGIFAAISSAVMFPPMGDWTMISNFAVLAFATFFSTFASVASTASLTLRVVLRAFFSLPPQ